MRQPRRRKHPSRTHPAVLSPGALAELVNALAEVFGSLRALADASTIAYRALWEWANPDRLKQPRLEMAPANLSRLHTVVFSAKRRIRKSEGSEAAGALLERLLVLEGRALRAPSPSAVAPDLEREFEDGREQLVADLNEALRHRREGRGDDNVVKVLETRLAHLNQARLERPPLDLPSGGLTDRSEGRLAPVIWDPRALPPRERREIDSRKLQGADVAKAEREGKEGRAWRPLGWWPVRSGQEMRRLLTQNGLVDRIAPRIPELRRYLHRSRSAPAAALLEMGPSDLLERSLRVSRDTDEVLAYVHVVDPWPGPQSAQRR